MAKGETRESSLCIGELIGVKTSFLAHLFPFDRRSPTSAVHLNRCLRPLTHEHLGAGGGLSADLIDRFAIVGVEVLRVPSYLVRTTAPARRQPSVAATQQQEASNVLLQAS